MTWESDETEQLDVLTPVGDRDDEPGNDRDYRERLDPDELEQARRAWICAESREEEDDEFEGFDEEDFDDDFDDDFEEEQDEEYEAENEEYPDTDFGTGADLDGDVDEVDLDGEIDGDFEDAEPDGDAEIADAEDGEDDAEEIADE